MSRLTVKQQVAKVIKMFPNPTNKHLILIHCMNEQAAKELAHHYNVKCVINDKELTESVLNGDVIVGTFAMLEHSFFLEEVKETVLVGNDWTRLPVQSMSRRV